MLKNINFCRQLKKTTTESCSEWFDNLKVAIVM